MIRHGLLLRPPIAGWLLLATSCGIVPASASSFASDSTQTPQPGAQRYEVTAAQTCDNLCTLTQLHCKYENRAYASVDACLSWCATRPALGEPGDTRGDTVQCRLTYALLAKHTLTMWFCQNASSSGGIQCH